MADIFDVIADGTRRDILQLLLSRSVDGRHGTSVSHIVQELGVSQPTVSKHLKVLRDASLVSVREEGQHRYYSLSPAPLDEVDDWLIPFLVDEDDLAGSGGERADADGFRGARRRCGRPGGGIRKARRHERAEEAARALSARLSVTSAAAGRSRLGELAGPPAGVLVLGVPVAVPVAVAVPVPVPVPVPVLALQRAVRPGPIRERRCSFARRDARRPRSRPQRRS